MTEEFDQLAIVLSPENGNERWNAFQRWLKQNPKYKKKVKHCLALTPREALDYLCGEFNFPILSVRLIWPKHPLIAKAESTITAIQELYREREAMDVKPPKRKGIVK